MCSLPRSSGEHYFEAVQCIKDKEVRHYQDRLALCPTCAAMYLHARETKDANLLGNIVKHYRWAEFKKLAGAWSGNFGRDAYYGRPMLR